MTNDEKKTKIEELLSLQDVFRVKDVLNVNHKPHPYIVGPKHITYASDNYGGILDERTLNKVKCDYKGCNLSYEEHTSDLVCFLQLKKNATNDEVKFILKELVDNVGETFIDGFGFVDTDEKFRIE